MNKQMEAQHKEILALHAKMSAPGTDKTATLTELTEKTLAFVNTRKLQQAEWSAEINRLVSKPIAPAPSTAGIIARAYLAWVVIVLAFIGIVAMVAR